MKFFSTGFATLALTASLIHNAVAVPASKLEARQTAPDRPEIGLRALGITAVHPRLELRQFANNREHMAILVNALTLMMNEPTTSRISYHQIASIHGSDRVYNGVPSGKAPGGGYCTHGTPNFPIFHRPYVSLMETSLTTLARRWISTIPSNQRQAYTNALTTFRFPYWDWASYRGLPDFMTSPSISVFTVQGGVGAVRSINNPLYTYRSSNAFLTLSGNARTTQTVRSPRNSGGVYVSQDQVSQNLLSNSFSGNRNSLNTIFQSITSWNTFSNQATSGNSIESLHGSPHVNVGGYPSASATRGHMGLVPIAAFDPAFWFHHCNVDRQIAIWQVINPNSYVSGSLLTSALTPFWNYTSSTYCTSSSSKDVRVFGYTYPELQQQTSPSGMRNLMRTMYGGSSPQATVGQATNTVAKRQAAGNSTDSSLGNTTVAAPTFDTVLSTPADPEKLAEKGRANLLNDTTTFNEYEAAIEVPSKAVSGSFSVYFFIGKFNSDKTKWDSDPNFVGKMDSFTAGDKMNTAVTLNGNVGLTQAVLNLINRDGNGLEDLKVRNVRTFLKENLKWEVTAQADVKVDKSQVKIKVQTARVKTIAATEAGEDPSQVWGPWRTIFTLA